MNLTAIGAYIAMLRQHRGLTQKELAHRLGVSAQAVSKWENAENLPDASLLLPLAETLHTTADAILGAGSQRQAPLIDLTRLHGGVAALDMVEDAFGADSAIGLALRDALERLGIDKNAAIAREQLLTEAILHRLMDGETLSDGALEATIQAEALRERIRKVRRDCGLFAGKQQYYDDFRPGYPAAAVDFIRTRIGENAVIADIGSGTGKLTALLAGHASRLYAVEPNVHMRRILRHRTAAFPQVQLIAATAEALPLPDHSVDAITVGEAYHWFDNGQTRAEFRRILKPGGHVFLLWNRFVRNAFYDEMLAIQQAYSTVPSPRQPTRAERADVLFGPGQWEQFTFDSTLQQSFEQFFGGMSSASSAPEAGTVDGKAYQAAVQSLFDKYAVRGRLATQVETVCFAGTLAD